MKKVHNNWIGLLLVIFIVIIINYHLNVKRQFEKYAEKKVIGPDIDKNHIIQGNLTVLNNFDNTIGKSQFPDSQGNILLVPESNKSVVMGQNARINQIGEKALNNQVGQSWFPHQNGNTYIRSGSKEGNIIVGDDWAKQISVGATGNKAVLVGTDTWLPWSDGNVFIRPDRNSRSKLIRIGDALTSTVEIGNPTGTVRLRGKTMLGETDGGDNSDPYYLEKVVNGRNNSFLKLNLADDPDESLQIWGNHCVTGNCRGSGAVQHTFRADGTAIHNNNICIKNTCINENDLKKLQQMPQ